MKVSIIVPVHNTQKYIKKCISSILHQTYNKFELIIINDNSTDKTTDILKNIKDSRIKIITNKTTKGVAESRNIGINNSNGEYIMFVDSDDYIENNMIEKFIEISKKYNPDLIICGICSETTKNKKYDKINDKEYFYKNKNLIKENLINLYEKELLYNVWNKFFKKSIITNNKIKFENINFGEDNNFNQKYIKYCNSIYNTNNCFYHYVREIKNSITTSYINDLFKIRKKENKIFENFFKELKIKKNIYIHFISKHFIERTIGCLENLHRKNNLTIKQKYKLTKEIINSKETIKYLKEYNTNNIKLKIILYTYRFKSAIPTFIIGILLHTIKKIAPNTFNKMKNKR